MDERWVRVLVTSGIWLVAIVVLRWLLQRAYTSWERRHVETDPAVVARRRTTFSFLSRMAIVLVTAIGAWSVLSIFPQTGEVARALLASSAVLAVVAGLALSTPLGNLGAGVLVSFTQPVRIGDRVTIGDQTGFVEQISMIYTTLVADDGKHVYVPNTQLTTNSIVNRTIRDPRRAVAVDLPVRFGAVADARTALAESTRQSAGVVDAVVRVASITDSLAWLTVTAYAPLNADVATIASDVREHGLAALSRDGLLPE
jgi:small conductance mechanosensitive channel